MGDSEMESNQRLASRVRRDPSANLSTGKTGKRPSEKQILLEEVEEHFPCRRFSNAPDKEPAERARSVVIDIKESDKTVLSYSKVCDLIKLVFPNTDINDKVTSIEYENCDFISRNRIFNLIETSYQFPTKTTLKFACIQMS